MKKNILIAAVLSLAAVPGFAQTAPTANEVEAVGTMATVQGTVEQITDKDEFIMKDATGMVKVDLGDTLVSLKVGDTVSVEGLVETDLQGRDMEARTLTGPDGNVVTIQHDGDDDNDHDDGKDGDKDGDTENGSN